MARRRYGSGLVRQRARDAGRECYGWATGHAATSMHTTASSWSARSTGERGRVARVIPVKAKGLALRNYAEQWLARTTPSVVGRCSIQYARPP